MNKEKKIMTMRHGFTLIETIAVLIVLGILAVFASIAFNVSDSEVLAQTEILKTHIRFAQERALSGDDTQTWGIQFSGSQYSLISPGAYSLPGESGSTHVFPNGVTVNGPASVTFDEWGTPNPDGLTLTVSSGGNSRNIVISTYTGYVP